MASHSNMSNSIPWKRNPTLGDFVWNSHTNMITLKSGQSYPCPPNVPRTMVEPARYDGPLPPWNPHAAPSSSSAKSRTPSAGSASVSLYPAFKSRPESFFKVGKVFQALWTEPITDNDLSGRRTTDPNIFTVGFQEKVYSKMRFFVVVRQGNSSCTCVAIYTHSGRGTQKPALDMREHAAVYTGREPPSTSLTSDRSDLLPSIRINPDVVGRPFYANSLLDFGRLHTIEHSIKVMSFGTVKSSSKANLLSNVDLVWLYRNEKNVRLSEYDQRRPGFFQRGKVFTVLWLGGTSSGVRMYVVLRQGTDDCSCFQLMNYQQSSVALERPETQAYVIAYTGNIGHDRNTRSVHVRADSAVDQLGPACHVDLSELTKVSYRLRVKAFGNVGQTSMHNLAAQFVSFCEQTEDTQQPIAAGVSRGQPSAQYLSNQTLPQHSQQQTSESEDDSEADDDSTMENPAPVISPKRLFQHLEIRSTAVHPSMAKVSRFVPNKELRIALPSRSQPMTPSTRELIIGDEGVLSTLFPDFRIRRTKFWTVGRVIVVLWGEPEGPNATRSSLAHSGRTTVWEPGIELNQVGERMFSKIRQFVIIREGKGYCYALPISTYAGRGVSDAGVVKSEHCIIYTGKLPPTPTADERPRGNEEAMQPVAIRLDPDTPDNLLDPMSRINLAAITILQDNNKVKPFGKINPISLNNLISQHDAVCKRRPAVGQARFPQHFDLVDREGESDEDDDEDDDEDEDEEGDDDNDDDA